MLLPNTVTKIQYDNEYKDKNCSALDRVWYLLFLLHFFHLL